jgi:hypothetical protein
LTELRSLSHILTKIGKQPTFLRIRFSIQVVLRYGQQTEGSCQNVRLHGVGRSVEDIEIGEIVAVSTTRSTVNHKDLIAW